MPLAHYLEAGIRVGLGSDVAAGPELSIFGAMRSGAYTQSALRVASGGDPVLGPLDWLRMGTLEGARVLGLEDVIGSIEVGKEADLIAVDPRLTLPLPEIMDVATDWPAGSDPAASDPATSDPEALVSRLIFRTHPSMVRAAWVRGRRLAGPGDA